MADIVRQLRDAVAQLEHAVRASDWESAATADRRLSAILGKVSADSIDGELRAALDAAQAVHAGALARCADECARLEIRLEDLRGQKEGWVAYALTDEQREAAL